MDPLRRAFRGYEPAQVDQLLFDARARVEGLEREVQVLRADNLRIADEAASLRASIEELRDSEEAVKGALVSAHRQANDVLEGSRRESEILLQVARETAARLQDDLRGRIDDLNWQIERLSLQKQTFLGEFRALLEGHLAELVEGPIGGSSRTNRFDLPDRVEEEESELSDSSEESSSTTERPNGVHDRTAAEAPQ